MEEDIYKPFTKILTFVKEINTLFGEKHPNISLYYKLLKKTPISNKGAVRKQNAVFRTFLDNNKEAIIEKDLSLFKDTNISFSERVYINITQVLKEADDNENIYKHLQVISAILIKDEKMIDALKDIRDNETKFLNKFMGKVENTFSGSEVKDPVKAAMSLMSSGILTDMSKEIQSGKLNIGKLIGNLQGMMTDVAKDIKESSPNSEEADKVNQTLNNLPNMINNLMNGNGDGGDIMGMVSGLMGGAPSSSSSMPGPSPDMMNMLNGLSGGGGQPDIMSMLSGLMGGGEAKGDIMSMMSGMMGGDSKEDMMTMMKSVMGQEEKVLIEETTTEETQE
jgi:hypothetical protein